MPAVKAAVWKCGRKTVDLVERCGPGVKTVVVLRLCTVHRC